jgi:class 3 adenylate cyclase
VDIPKTRWAKTADGDNVAYQLFGHGSVTIILIAGWVTHLELYWEQPGWASFMRRLAEFARVISFDRRGTGLSERLSALPDLESRMDDVRAVMDATDTEQAALFGLLDGAALAALFAATYPERTTALLFCGYARSTWAPDYPFGVTEEEDEAQVRRLQEIWGLDECAEEFVRLVYGDIPLPDDPAFALLHSKQARYAATLKSMATFNRMWYDTDARDILPSIHVPTIVLSPSLDHAGAEAGSTLADEAAYIAGRIPGAKVATYEGNYAVMWLGDSSHLTALVKRFLSTVRAEEAELDRVLATVLFTDIVGSTEKAAKLGDHEWKGLLDRHHAAVRSLLARYRGTEVKTTGDGFLATFDGSARAVRCAEGICEAVRPLGLEVRAGCHTGEIEVLGDDVGGFAVHIVARVAAKAKPSEVLVSSTVKDLVAGSALSFVDRGSHALEGVPGRWRLYGVSA